jgi:hypothetical protein
MKSACWLAALFLATLSLFSMGLGGFVALSTDWVPTREISSFERRRAELATDFVEAEERRRGRLPTYVEFQEWIVHAPPELHVDGQGFNYWPEREQYSFSWWDGDASVTWHPRSHRSSVLISPKDAFLLGSKLSDLSVLFGAGAVLLVAAYGLVQIGRRSGAYAS